MKTATFVRAFAVLLALCCLVPMVMLGAVIFLDAPVWPTSMAALFVLLLLARRLFALLATPESATPRSPGNFSLDKGPPNHDHRQS
jgi:hypothetical protein